MSVCDAWGNVSCIWRIMGARDASGVVSSIRRMAVAVRGTEAAQAADSTASSMVRMRVEHFIGSRAWVCSHTRMPHSCWRLSEASCHSCIRTR